MPLLFCQPHRSLNRWHRHSGKLHGIAFLDRDGVLIHDSGYPHKPDQLRIHAPAVKWCQELQALGYALVIVSNQSGIARALFRPVDYQLFTDALLQAYRKHGVHFRAVLACPHHRHAGHGPYTRFCICRKPAPGMLVTAMRLLGFGSNQVLMIGDKSSDMQAARAAGIRKRFKVDSSGNLHAEPHSRHGYNNSCSKRAKSSFRFRLRCATLRAR